MARDSKSGWSNVMGDQILATLGPNRQTDPAVTWDSAHTGKQENGLRYCGNVYYSSVVINHRRCD